jgi:ABC-2 type transport system ATP-binding protein
MADAAIVCEGLVKRYGDVVGLDGLNLTVPAGSIFGFLGPNGAGKTTTVRLLTGLTRPSAGRASVAGLDVVSSGTRLRQHVSYLAQQPEFYGWMRGRELLQFTGELFGMSGSTLRTRVDEVLEQTGLTEAARRKVSDYSGGMRQRLGLAQALINRPDVLFLDEPVSALDPAGRHEILTIIDSLRGHATVFMSTHILADVERICDHVAILDRGQLIVSSTVAELQERYAQPIFELEPDPGQIERVADLTARLKRQPWVGSLSHDGATLRVVASSPADAAAGILPLVAEIGVTLARFERGRPSLEDIFLRLVGERERTSMEAA